MCRITKGEWLLLYFVAGLIDFLQLLISWTGIGLGISATLDPFIGLLLASYIQFRGFSVIQHPTVLISLLGGTIIDAITGGIAPAWIVDVWIIKKIVDAEQAKYRKSQEQEEFLRSNMQKPLYEGGMRRPETKDIRESGPSNVDGVRAPNGGL